MKFFTDDQILSRMASAYGNAVKAPREGGDTGRGAGSSGFIAAEWMRWRAEADKRGLI